MRRTTIIVLVLAALFTLPRPGLASKAARLRVPDQWGPLAERLADDGFNPEFLRIVFSDPALDYDPGPMARKANALLRARLRQDRPGTMAPLPDLHHRYLKKDNIRAARDFMRDNREILDAAADRYHVPVEILTALALVETNLGRVTGKRPVVRILACMAATDSLGRVEKRLKNRADLTPDLRPWLDGRIKEKSAWAYDELAALLSFCQENTISPMGIKGSVYGAFGLCQFMPSNAVKFGVDGNGDGRVDLFDRRDALMSMANYLKGHGWTPAMAGRRPLVRSGDRTRYDPEMIKVVWEYNHSLPYSRTILAVADRLDPGTERAHPLE